MSIAQIQVTDALVGGYGTLRVTADLTGATGWVPVGEITTQAVNRQRPVIAANSNLDTQNEQRLSGRSDNRFNLTVNYAKSGDAGQQVLRDAQEQNTRLVFKVIPCEPSNAPQQALGKEKFEFIGLVLNFNHSLADAQAQTLNLDGVIVGGVQSGVVTDADIG